MVGRRKVVEDRGHGHEHHLLELLELARQLTLGRNVVGCLYLLALQLLALELLTLHLLALHLVALHLVALQLLRRHERDLTEALVLLDGKQVRLVLRLV